MVFMVYESAPRKVPKQVGIVGRSATNLVYLHPYLSDYHWSLIAQRVANFGNENCINLMVSSGLEIRIIFWEKIDIHFFFNLNYFCGKWMVLFILNLQPSEIIVRRVTWYYRKYTLYHI